MTSLSSVDQLSHVRDPLDWTPVKSALLVEACRELCRFHRDRCPEIAHLYERWGFDPASLIGEEDLERIPPLSVSAMKSFLITSRPEEEAVLKLTSSGTRGQKTQIWFDRESLERVQRMLGSVWTQEGLVSTEPTNYLMFIYDPEHAKNLGTAFTRKNQQRFAPPNETIYAIRTNLEGAWEFDKTAVLSALRGYEDQALPVRICGIPSFINEFLDWLPSTARLELSPTSYVFTGGGWKAAEDKEIPRSVFRSKITARLGIVDSNIRDGFGMAEHSAPCIECSFHRFHVPAFSRFVIRDPVTLEPRPPGERGLLSLITAYNTMMPNVAILSTDLGLIEGESCPCGHASPTFLPLGRGGTQKHKRCAIVATEIVKRL